MRIDKLTKMGRRRFVESLAALGVTGTALTNASKSALAESDVDLGNEVPMVRVWKHTNHEEVVENGAKPEREPEYFGVPRDQWVKVQSARDAAERLRNQLDVPGVQVGVTTVTRGQKPRKAVVVKHQTEEYDWQDDFSPGVSVEDLRDELPATMTGVAGRGTEKARAVKGIPVVTKQQQVDFTDDAVSTAASYDYDCNYRPVPAGCAWRTEKGNVCTTGTPVHDDDHNENRLVTASHCFLSYDATDCRQNYGSGDEIGTRDKDKINFDHPPNLFDAAVVDLNSGTDVRRDLADEQCDTYRDPGIAGTMDDDWLHQLEDNGYNVTKQGARTGISSGTVKEVYDTYFEVDTTINGGDSGCPFYKNRTDSFATYTYIGGILRGGDPAQVTKMTEIESRFSVTV